MNILVVVKLNHMFFHTLTCCPSFYLPYILLVVVISPVIIFHVFPPDYLDNGNNKMAIQQADKLLKKHKDLHCAKVGD